MRTTLASPCRATQLLLATLVFCGGRWPLSGQEVAPVFATGTYSGSNADSCAVWVAPNPDDSLLFVTEKDLDRIEIWRAGTGAVYAPRPFLGGPLDSSAPGEFNRPNGVWVIYHVPYAGGFADILLVTDQMNRRVEIFRLPELDYFGELGAGQVGKGYGISWTTDATDIFVYITDNIPPAGSPGKLKKFRLRPDGDRLGADLLFGVGSSSGPPPLPNVESILADPFHDRLHVCGDEGGDFNLLFRLDGTYTGVNYGAAQFQSDQEGINLYDAGGGRGYLLVSDQIMNGDPNQFEVFDRGTLAPLGNFHSPPGGSLVTRNTDGAFLEQRPLPGLPDGAFFAVNDDHDAHAYDWTSIAQAMDLDIVPLDRPFPGRAGGGPAPAPEHARSALWFHDGSWWGTLQRGDDLTISRLEDGTFTLMQVLDAEAAAGAEAWPDGDSLTILVAAGVPRVLRFAYESALRRYRPLGKAAAVDGATGPLATLALETGGGGSGRGWIAWVEGGELRVKWSEADLTAWNDAGAALGPAAAVLPRLVRLQGGIGLLWAKPGGIAYRAHADGDPPDSWSPEEEVSAAVVESLAVAAAPDGRVLAAGATAAGEATLWSREAGGSWTAQALGGGVSSPSLVVDAARSEVHLVHGADVSGHRLLRRRRASLPDLAFGPVETLLGWPGVDLEPPLAAAAVPADAVDLIVAAMGDDGLGYFARLQLPSAQDASAPITFQHSPPPGTADLPAETAISFRITDGIAGVDRATLRLLVNGKPVTPQVRGVPWSYLVRYALPAGTEPVVTVRIEAADRAAPAHRMQPFEYQLVLGKTQGAAFRRGDANGDGEIDLADALRLFLVLFGGIPASSCLDAEDVNDDGRRGTADAIALLGFLFEAGAGPPPPLAACGFDPTADALDCLASAACAGR